MSELDPRLKAFTTQEFWNSHYNSPDGKAKVEARQKYYWCLPPGEYPPDYDLEMLSGAQEAGIGPDATIADIGCSFPHFLELWKLLGHQGRLVGVEPNIMQFDGLPYWKPLSAAHKLLELEIARDTTGNGDFYISEQGDGTKSVDGIELYQSDAGNLPFEDNTIDFAAAMWSLYQLNEAEILPALHHIDSKLKEGGIFGAALSGKANKPNLQKFMSDFAIFMSQQIGRNVTSPPPLQEGCTTEKGIAMLSQVFEYVAHKHFSQELVVYDDLSVGFLTGAILSFSDRFLSEDGAPLEEEFVHDSLINYLDIKLWPDIESGKYFYDQTDRGLILCSQKPFTSSSEFKPIKVY